MSVWHGIWLPKGTPPEIVARLNAAVREALADPDVRELSRKRHAAHLLSARK
jgi:tripartite-type tricarboxylate transporter receptor subunit TctC